MEKQYKVVLDTKGADRGPSVMLAGAKLALEKYSELALLLVGDEAYLLKESDALGLPMERVEILDAPGEVTNFDSPVAALYEKQDSSVVRGMSALSEREDLVGFVGAGSTGALLSCAFRYLALPGSERVRPALAAVLPSVGGGFTCLVDTGATIDCDAKTILHFARLGSDFMKKMYGIENPRVGLLSNGAEETKGNKVVKEAHALIRAAEDLNFIGNVEGSYALSGCCDVLACDGFAGNQVLKVTEGTAKRILTDIGKYAKKTGSAEIMQLLSHLMQIYDIASLGGGNILGLRKPVVKAHGACDERAVVSTVGMILNMVQNKEIFDSQYAENM